jgi:hypothetical protein
MVPLIMDYPQRVLIFLAMNVKNMNIFGKIFWLAIIFCLWLCLVIKNMVIKPDPNKG